MVLDDSRRDDRINIPYYFSSDNMGVFPAFIIHFSSCLHAKVSATAGQAALCLYHACIGVIQLGQLQLYPTFLCLAGLLFPWFNAVAAASMST